MCSESRACTFLCFGTEESVQLLFALPELLGGSWLPMSASVLGLLCAGLLGFWEDEEDDEDEGTTGGGGSISFLEHSEEGLGVFDLEDSAWEDEDEDVCDLSSRSLLWLCSFSGSAFLFLVTRLELSQPLASESCFFPAGSCLCSDFLGRPPLPGGCGTLVRRSKVIFTTKLVGGGESLSGESSLVSLKGNRSLSLQLSSWVITACRQPLVLPPPLPRPLLGGPWL